MNSLQTGYTPKLYTGRFSLSGNALKLIACVTMLGDHGAKALLKRYIYNAPQNREIFMLLQYIGRVAFPIYVFLLVVGFVHTHSVKKYAARLFIFALISEIPYDLALYDGKINPASQNVYITLFFGLILMWCMRTLLGTDKLSRPLAYALCVPCAAACTLATYLLKADYGRSGVLAIGIAYLLYQIPVISTAAACTVLTAFNSSEKYAFFALAPILLYNGKRGRQSKALKWLFYFFYPVHLLLLYVIRICT